MNRTQKKEIVATLIRAGKRDLAQRFVRAGQKTAVGKWEDKGDKVHVLQKSINIPDAVGKMRQRHVVLRVDGREGT